MNNFLRRMKKVKAEYLLTDYFQNSRYINNLKRKKTILENMVKIVVFRKVWPSQIQYENSCRAKETVLLTVIVKSFDCEMRLGLSHTLVAYLVRWPWAGSISTFLLSFLLRLIIIPTSFSCGVHWQPVWGA